ncbi:MAG: TetR/AcrR family transcriptional regulator, partial [Anaerolineales bacterium]|nr:TetR/AcrR family transcriptional regulator [Anaerolineales bacterium]
AAACMMSIRCMDFSTDRSVEKSMQRMDIIQAAAQIFRQKGYHGTSMQDIADAVHLQKASLYHHITGKQEILVAILDQALELLIDDMQAVVNSTHTPQEKIRLAMRTYVHRLTQDLDLATVLLMEHRSLDEELRAIHIERRDRFEALWRGIVEEGIDSSVFRPVDARLTSFAFLGVLNWMITWYRHEGSLSGEQIADRFADLLLAGLIEPGQGL